jgi:hypothetical protein
VARILKLTADYECWPLWVDGGEIGNVDPADLPLTHRLRTDLMSWATAYDRTLSQTSPPDSGFATEADKSAWIDEGRRLADELRSQLGADWQVVYFHDHAD